MELTISISHTIAAVLLVPIAERIGDSLSEPHPKLLIMVSPCQCNWKKANQVGHRIDLFGWYGTSRLRFPKYDCVCDLVFFRMKELIVQYYTGE